MTAKMKRRQFSSSRCSAAQRLHGRSRRGAQQAERMRRVVVLHYLETRSENPLESMMPPFHPSWCAAPMADLPEARTTSDFDRNNTQERPLRCVLFLRHWMHMPVERAAVAQIKKARFIATL